ncbi:GntR family transcriptional regulator [Leucobacter sp. UCD-THU]|jgi:DNA-binding GntR family transcriptional regulator|uniref:GntR family transcriptional regulator n=1 Tax=Leucobacter muris TaxID=1935379 RepID=A0ABX5QIY0_9MICO|nr:MULTISPECIES: GntR family transcriptional regulator [Leucobacter]EYT51798.1 GntR family transcriptional regulator [Leucobacter sp. UCD-THU]QAB18885.1 GntR family transcriptional regulator [Leucobacter muris]
MEQLRTVERRRLSDVAFQRLLEAIIREDLAPGARIRDAELAAQLGLSRTPVREAVNRLVDLGLAESKPSAHTRVTTLTARSVERTLEILQSLDRLAVEQAVPNIGPAQLAELQRMNDRFAEAIRSGSAAAVLDADVTFHQALREYAENPVLMRVMSQLDPHVQRILFRKFSSRLGAPNTVHHHVALLDLIAAGDAAGAASSSAQQWRELGGQIGELFAD